MQYKPIKNYHMENEVIGKDFNLSMNDFLFHAFTPCDHYFILDF
jgi:hypothetical protein